MEAWDTEEVIRWIKQRGSNILKGDNLEKFNKAGIIGRAFLASDVDFYESCGLPRGIGLALKDLADEVKGDKITDRKRKGENIFNVAYGQPANNINITGDETDAPEQSISPKRYRAPLPSSSTLVVSGELEKFPLTVSDFHDIRQPGLAYFDKTKYIAKLQKMAPNVQLVCRPRRFGKSLTVSMLRYFHGFQFRNQYDKLFKDLDVDKAVKDGIVQPGQYLVLYFDFSCVTRTHKMDKSVEFLGEEINYGLSKFKLQYTKYLGQSFASETSGFIQDNPARNLRVLIGAVDDALEGIQMSGDEGHPLWGVRGIYLLADEYDAYANGYMDPHDPRSWSNTDPFNLLKSFWSNVKAGKSAYGIKKVYITGVTPLLLNDVISGGNDHENISFSQQISAICGLTQSDVLEALRIICNSKEEVQKHFEELKQHANGYHFCDERKVDPVFNTQTALSYLQAVKTGGRPLAENPPNSEVSELFLQACVKVPAAMNDMQFALQKDEHGSYQKIPCKEVLRGFILSQLNIQAAGERDISILRSLMFYMGALTLDSDEPSKFLKIPNLIAAKRFGSALLNRHGIT